MILKQIRPTIFSFLILTVITGIFYPVLITVIAQTCFQHQANGSLLMRNGKAIGSELIGQAFDDPKYLWGRPSATGPVAFNGASSSGSNFGPLNVDYLNSIEVRVEALKKADPTNVSPIPVDLVTASASGLDPHISIAAALYQVGRIARARGISQQQVQDVIKDNTQHRFLGILGEPVVHVLKVNLKLDEIART
jgi:K+-transporting ATPase ATPase C chain